MSTLKNKIIVGGMAAAILSGGAATAWAQTNDNAPQPAETSSSSSPHQDAQGEHHHKGHRLDTAALAQKLGVSEDQLNQAFNAIRQDQPTGDQGRGQGGDHKGNRPDRTAMDQALANKLGIDVSKVTAAMDELRTQDESEESATRREELSSKLDAAVSAGTLSSADRDSVLKAFDAGVFNFDHHDHGGQDGESSSATPSSNTSSSDTQNS